MGMANPKRSQEKPRDQRPRRDPRGLTSRELPRLRLHETSQEASLLFVSGEPRKVGREGRRALDPEPEDIVKARRLRRLAGQVGCGRLQSARTASPPEERGGVEIVREIMALKCGRERDTGRSEEGKGRESRAHLVHRAKVGGAYAGHGLGFRQEGNARVPGVERTPLLGLLALAEACDRLHRDRGEPDAGPVCLLDSQTQASRAPKFFRPQTFLKERGDLSPRNRNNAR